MIVTYYDKGEITKFEATMLRTMENDEGIYLVVRNDGTLYFFRPLEHAFQTKGDLHRYVEENMVFNLRDFRLDSMIDEDLLEIDAEANQDSNEELDPEEIRKHYEKIVDQYIVAFNLDYDQFADDIHELLAHMQYKLQSGDVMVSVEENAFYNLLNFFRARKGTFGIREDDIDDETFIRYARLGAAVSSITSMLAARSMWIKQMREKYEIQRATVKEFWDYLKTVGEPLKFHEYDEKFAYTNILDILNIHMNNDDLTLHAHIILDLKHIHLEKPFSINKDISDKVSEMNHKLEADGITVGSGVEDTCKTYLKFKGKVSSDD